MGFNPLKADRRRKTFARSNHGLAAVEFALILPVMLAFIFGGYETVRAITCARRLTILANAIVQQVTSNTTGTILNTDAHFYYNTAMVVFPQSMKDAARYNNYWWQDVNVAISSIAFTTVCTLSCTYVPNVIWSVNSSRSCVIPPTPASNTAAPSMTTLPIDIYGPGSLIVVDVTYNFHTIFSGNFLGSYLSNLNTLVFRKSAYAQPRYVSTIKYNPIPNTALAGSDDIVTWCLINSL